MTINQKLCKNIIINTSSNICFEYLFESPPLGDSNISKTYVLWGNKNKTKPFLHINLLNKASLKQQIHFNGNIFENKCCRRNEISLYVEDVFNNLSRDVSVIEFR